MKTILLFFLCFFSYVLAEQSAPKEITHYKVLHQAVTFQHQNYTILRSFMIDNESAYWLVNEKDLKSVVVKASSLTNALKRSAHNSRYNDLLNKYTQAPYTLYNYGLKHIASKSIYLTVDMCPSSKVGYEDGFFKELIKKYYTNKAIPVTIFISGKWIEKHQENFLELLALQESEALDIIWGNHTFSHHYDRNTPNEKNFLLTPNINVEDEIIKNEKLLLSYGITPSILFRLPGLISDEKVVSIIKSLGLIPISSDTWLAKNEEIHKGSVILIHGNKNEPYGIKKANEQLIEKRNFVLGSILDDL